MKKKDKSQAKLATYQWKMTRYYNAKVKKKSFCMNDLVLRRVFPSSKEPSTSTLGPKWEGPYYFIEEIRLNIYRIEDLEEKIQSHPWNSEHLRKHYQ